MKVFAGLARPTIRNERELVRFVALVTAFALTFALAVDVVDQLTSFVDWTRCLRSWSVTTVVCLLVATPIAYSVGQAHLQLFRAKELAVELARTDSLTNLSNRRALIEDAESALAEVRTLTIFDIDHFKAVNDAYGHLVGDATIRAVGRLLQEELGALGLVARVGGEEFALLTSRTSLEDVVERLLSFRDRLRATPILVGDVTLRVTVSAGVALRENGDSFDRLYGLADRALYEAKAAGRNQFRFPPSLEPFVNQLSTRFELASRVTTLRSA
jgi:diguanylate cyclase (GGDEF)-like protein